MRNWPHLNFTGWFFVAKIKKIKSINSQLTSNDEKELKNNKWNNKNEEIKHVRQNIEKISNTDEKKIKDFFKNNFDFDISNYWLYDYNWEIHLLNYSLEDIWEKIFLYKIGVNIWNIKDWLFVPNFYAWTFTKFNKNFIEVNKSDLDRLLKWFELEKELNDWYYQIIYDNLEMWLAKFKNWKLKSLILTKLMRK
jgi:hypothetical protein